MATGPVPAMVANGPAMSVMAPGELTTPTQGRKPIPSVAARLQRTGQTSAACVVAPVRR